MGAPEWAAIGASTGFAYSAKARDLPHQFTRAARSGGTQCSFCFCWSLICNLQFVLPLESPECTAATSPSRGEEATGQQCGSLLEGGRLCFQTFQGVVLLLLIQRPPRPTKTSSVFNVSTKTSQELPANLIRLLVIVAASSGAAVPPPFLPPSQESGRLAALPPATL